MKADNVIPHKRRFWWGMSPQEVIELLNLDSDCGLSGAMINERRACFGSNSIGEYKTKTLIALMWEGLQQPMMLVLLAVAMLSLLFGKVGEAATMLFVVVAYIAIELLHKYRADRVMVQLKVLSSPTSRVLRNGILTFIATSDIVVGDIIVLAPGTIVPADARLLISHSLKVNEAVLTGEALPVIKNADAILDIKMPLSGRINSVFSGTTVIDGEGTAAVMAVGVESEWGKIVQQVHETRKEQTILQESMTRLSKISAFFAVTISALIPAIGYMRGLSLQEMVLTWLSLTFLMIPGQPPIIITMALSLAAFLLARKGVMVKRLRGVEVIGQVTTIVSDKTGTITKSTMAVECFYDVQGTAIVGADLSRDMQDRLALAIPDYFTDPTDTAVMAALDGVHMQKKLKQIGYSGFSDDRTWRDLMYQLNGTMLHVLTGRPDTIIEKSRLSHEKKMSLIERVRCHANQGKRIIAYASIENNNTDIDICDGLEFIAIAVMSDPIRSDVKEAISSLHKADVQTIIATGDYEETARSIAERIGMRGYVLSGPDLEQMTDEQLRACLHTSPLFVRMDPLQKLRIVKLLQHEGEVVAVVGDGINDAPALKAAQVSIAMGQIGTDIAKEVSDLVLTDDNYVRIPDAIAIGRRALDNFRKGLTYYLSAKTVLLVLFLVPLIANVPFPFTPTQIIFVELLMDLASSTLFVTEQAEPNSMTRPAQKVRDFLNISLIYTVVQYAMPLAIGIIYIYMSTYRYDGLVIARTTALVAWLIGHILLALNMKQEKVPLLIQGIAKNKIGLFWLCAMPVFSYVITSVALIHPYLQTTRLSSLLWLKVSVIVIISTFWIEILKLLRYASVLRNVIPNE